MLHLVYGHDHEVAGWVGRELSIKDFGPCVGIGIARRHDIIGGAVYNNFHYDITGRPLFIEMSFATIDKGWANRGIIKGLLDYPFFQLRVKRVQLTIAKRNKHTRQFVERLGFKLEGIARKAHVSGSDAAVYSLLDGEWKASVFNGFKKSNMLPSTSISDSLDSAPLNSISNDHFSSSRPATH